MSELAETGYAKLNLALHVRGRMPDGYHSIETVFAFCENGDELTASKDRNLSVDVAGPFAAELPREEMIHRAASLLSEQSGYQGGARIQLMKRLPVASGVGGGSADAAAALRLLNRLWGLDWPIERLEQIAREIGADVPACLHSRGLRGDGRGDQLQPVELGLAGTPVLLVNPRTELSTAEVYSRWDGHDRGPLGDWRAGRNDLQAAAVDLAPLVGTVLAWLGVQSGAEVVRMSGSGATCFAMFRSKEARDTAATAVPREWWRLSTSLR